MYTSLTEEDVNTHLKRFEDPLKENEVGVVDLRLLRDVLDFHFGIFLFVSLVLPCLHLLVVLLILLLLLLPVPAPATFLKITAKYRNVTFLLNSVTIQNQHPMLTDF